MAMSPHSEKRQEAIRARLRQRANQGSNGADAGRVAAPTQRQSDGQRDRPVVTPLEKNPGKARVAVAGLRLAIGMRKHSKAKAKDKEAMNITTNKVSKNIEKGASGGVKGISGAAIAAGVVGFASSKGWLPEGYEVTALVFLTGIVTAGLHAGSNFVKNKWGIHIPIVTGILILLAPAFVFTGCAKTVGENGSWEFSVNMDSVERALLLSLDLTQRIQQAELQKEALEAEAEIAKREGQFDRAMLILGEIQRISAAQAQYSRLLRIQGAEVKKETKSVPKLLDEPVSATGGV